MRHTGDDAAFWLWAPAPRRGCASIAENPLLPRATSPAATAPSDLKEEFRVPRHQRFWPLWVVRNPRPFPPTSINIEDPPWTSLFTHPTGAPTAGRPSVSSPVITSPFAKLISKK